MPDIKALREAVKNCDASAALNALPALLDEVEARRDNDVRGMCIIEAAIRSPSIAHYMSHWEGRCLKAETALAAVRGRVCGTCRYTFEPSDCERLSCELASTDVTYIYCETFGFTCGAWAAKEQA